jgi:hypothetical protein
VEEGQGEAPGAISNFPRPLPPPPRPPAGALSGCGGGAPGRGRGEGRAGVTRGAGSLPSHPLGCPSGPRRFFAAASLRLAAAARVDAPNAPHRRDRPAGAWASGRPRPAGSAGVKWPK